MQARPAASSTRASPAPTRISPAARPSRDLEAVACPTFEDALQAVKAGDARYAMIPIENSVAGRVADIHHLLPDADLYIVGEHFLRVRHQLMAAPGASLKTVKRVLSHTHALGQCRKHAAQARTDARAGGRHRRLGAHGQGGERPRARRHRIGARRRDLRPRDPRRRRRGRGAQHDALRRARRRARRRRAGRRRRSSRPSSSACATFRPRSTRRWAASRPTAST